MGLSSIGQSGISLVVVAQVAIGELFLQSINSFQIRWQQPETPTSRPSSRITRSAPTWTRQRHLSTTSGTTPTRAAAQPRDPCRRWDQVSPVFFDEKPAYLGHSANHPTISIWSKPKLLLRLRWSRCHRTSLAVEKSFKSSKLYT